MYTPFFSLLRKTEIVQYLFYTYSYMYMKLTYVINHVPLCALFFITVINFTFNVSDLFALFN